MVVAAEGRLRYPEDGPQEADLSRRHCEAGPASGPHEAGRATPGGGHGRPSVLHFVAPRLRATGLPCIASPEIMSSGNTQHLGIEITALLKLAEA